MRHLGRGACAAAGLVLSWALTTGASAVVIDFETEDDFVTQLVNGQIVDPAYDAVDLEFGNLFNVSTTQAFSNGPGEMHLGATVFDSDPGDQLPGTQDPDLLVGTGNILILQNDDSPGTANPPPTGLEYVFPNDEKDRVDGGGILFDFFSPVEVLSIDIVDADSGFGGEAILTDGGGLKRTYTINALFSHDITTGACGGCDGYETLDLTTLLTQVGEGGGTATATEDAGFNPTNVLSLHVRLLGKVGGTSSGGIDNLIFVPEPATGALFGFGLAALAAYRRRA